MEYMTNDLRKLTIKDCIMMLMQVKEHEAALEEELKNTKQQLSEALALINWYEEQHRLNLHRRFGSSSERTCPEQLSLFNEVEDTADPLEPEPTMETITYQRRKARKKREASFKNLPVEEVHYRLDDAERACPACGELMHEMSTEERQDLKVIPAQVKVVRHIRHVYSCRRCEREEISTPIKTAPMPAPVIPKSIASPSAIAYVIDQKYVNAIPLYRQEKYFSRFGIELSRQTLANWVLEGTERWLEKLYERMHEHLLSGDIIQADETPLQVLHEPGKQPQSQSYMWVYRTGKDGPPIILYEYQPSRSGKNPEAFLEGFKGYLQVDGYAGYDKLPNVTLVGCWAHARRKFDEALKALPKGSRDAKVTAREGLDFCNQLFAIERELKDVSAEERYNARLACSRPVLDAFSAWLDTQSSQVLPKSTLGQAITYCKKQWDKLIRFLDDGRLEIDNNRSERSIKPFVIGRKNWLFSNTPRGAKASAVCYSIIETAKENGLNPFTYLTYLFETLPNVNINDPEVVDTLLPWSPALPEKCRSRI
jgi:transposase